MNPFPASANGHSRSDERDTFVVSLSLHRLKPGATAFPSIALLEKDGYDTRVASNGKFIYWWNGSELVALELQSIQTYLAHVVHRSSVKPSVSSTKVVRHVVSKKR